MPRYFRHKNIFFKNFLLVILLALCGVGVSKAQSNFAAPNVDEASVQGDGSQPAQNSTGAQVNTFTGDVWATATDFNYTRNGFPMKFERYFHNGITSPYSELGQNWMSNYDISLIFPPSGPIDHVLLITPHQTWKFLSTDGGLTFTTPHGCFLQLQNISSGHYVLNDKSGIVYKFMNPVAQGAATNLASLTEVDDLNQNKITLAYQTYGQYQTVSGGVTNTYQAVRLQTATGNNWAVTFNYYDSGNPASNNYGNRLAYITNSAGDSVTFDTTPNFSATPQNLPVSQVSRYPSNLNASYTYYANPANTTLKQIIDPLSSPGYRNITYICENNPSTLTNRVRQIRNALGQVMYSYDYSTDSNGEMIASTSGPNGLLETDVYNPAGLLAQKRFVVDGHPYSQFFTYNADLLPTYIVDGNGNPTTMAYDSLGNLIYTKDAEGYFESATYFNKILVPTGITGTGVVAYYTRVHSTTDKNQVTTIYSYDSNGNTGGNGNLIQTSVLGTNRVTNSSYSFSGGTLTQKTITDANTHTTTYSYNANMCVTLIQGPTGNTISYAYDSNGPDSRNQMVSSTDGLSQQTSYTYTSNKAWLQQVSYSDGSYEEYSYDSNGNRVFSQNRNFVQTICTFDGADHLTNSNEGNGARQTSYKYDALGNQTALIDQNNHQTTFIYNEQNLPRIQSDALGIGTTNTYDGALRLRTVKDSRGITKTMNYYKNNRLLSIQFSDGTPRLSYSYDGNGNLISSTDGVGTKNYIYDALNEPTTVTDSIRNFTLSYSYDAAGNKLSSQNNKVPGSIFYSYYSNNLLKTITDWDSMATTYVYDPVHNPTNLYYPNGASVTYSYMATNHRLQSLQNLNSHGEILSSFSNQYDGVGNPVTVSSLTGQTAYSFDNLNQMTSASYPGPKGTVNYIYDGVGNATTVVQAGVTQTLNYDSGNAVTAGLGESFNYDKAGNMTSRTSNSTSYTWNALNQLVKVSSSSGAVTFAYDGGGHRVLKMSANGTINYFYDGNSVVLEIDGNGKILKKYNPGISVTDQQGNKFFYLSDSHGDVSGLMDIKQNLVKSYAYDAYGQTLGVQKDANNYRFVGGLSVFSDDDINLQYMHHRWYDPKLGRFISRDPIGLKGGLNLYGYCNNNPTRFVDPSGQNWLSNLAGFILAFFLLRTGLDALSPQAIENSIISPGAPNVPAPNTINPQSNSLVITVDCGSPDNSSANQGAATSEASTPEDELVKDLWGAEKKEFGFQFFENGLHLLGYGKYAEGLTPVGLGMLSIEIINAENNYAVRKGWWWMATPPYTHQGPYPTPTPYPYTSDQTGGYQGYTGYVTP